MIQPATETLRAFRNVTFDDSFVIDGLDLSGAGLLMQVRQYRDAPGAALVELEVVADADLEDGLEISVDTGGFQPVTTIRMRLHYNTLQALPDGTDPEDTVTLEYDLITTGVNFAQAMLFRGDFVVEATVTRLP